jgi:hypothetical protein
MTEHQLKTPVAFIIFNRPDTTVRVFADIRRARPAILLVIADGPRTGKLGEAEKCVAVREIIDRVDWPCEVLTNYSDVNMGCKNRVASGLDWVFEQVPEAIILEDDCLPHPTFFRFCEELLEYYRDDERIGMISGDNFQFGQKRTSASYYFSRYAHIWGWASWRRAWGHYDRDASAWPAIRDAGWLDIFAPTPGERKHWSKVFESVYKGQIDTWDYQWNLALLSQGMVSVIPNANLISNIGFGAEATHTRGASKYANMEVEAISFPIKHPEIILPHRKADEFTAKSMFTGNILNKMIQKMHALRRL